MYAARPMVCATGNSMTRGSGVRVSPGFSPATPCSWWVVPHRVTPPIVRSSWGAGGSATTESAARLTVSTWTRWAAGSSTVVSGGSSVSVFTPRRRCWSSRSAANSAAVIERAMRPLTITSTVSAMSMATPRFCSISSTEISPSAARAFTMATTCCTTIGARPSVGSSMTSSFGLSNSARAIASICCSPPDSSAPPLALRSASRGKVW